MAHLRINHQGGLSIIGCPSGTSIHSESTISCVDSEPQSEEEDADEHEKERQLATCYVPPSKRFKLSNDVETTITETEVNSRDSSLPSASSSSTDLIQTDHGGDTSTVTEAQTQDETVETTNDGKFFISDKSICGKKDAICTISGPRHLWMRKHNWTIEPLPAGLNSVQINHTGRDKHSTPLIQRLDRLRQRAIRAHKAKGKNGKDPIFQNINHHVAVYKGELVGEEEIVMALNETDVVPPPASPASPASALEQAAHDKSASPTLKFR